MIAVNIFLILMLVITMTIAVTVTVKTRFRQDTININHLNQMFLHNKGIKVKYLPLRKSRVFDHLTYMFETKHVPMKFEQRIFDNKNYLLSLSKFIDFKINSNKQRFRSKDNLILIDQISQHLACSLLTTGKCNLFSNFKCIAKEFKVKQKEFKIFKPLLAQKLMLFLFQIETEFIEISNVIKNAKSAQKLCKYNKKLLFDAQIYSIDNFNSNSSKILYGKDISVKKSVSNLFSELFFGEKKLNLIISYLIAMFN